MATAAICDAHCHFFSDAFFTALLRSRPDLPQDDPDAVTTLLGWQAPGSPDALADTWAAELDRHRVNRAALIASVPGDEGSVAAAVARHPRRFVGFFMLNPTGDEALARVSHALATLNLRGVCLFPAMHKYEIHDDRVMRVAEVVASIPGAALFVHCGVLSIGVRKKLRIPGSFDIRFGNPLGAHVLASTFPALPMIIPHFGAGYFREALMAADLSPNIYLDTSSSNGWIKYHPGLTLSSVFTQALDVIGSKRMLFGTDSSFFPRGWQRSIWELQRDILAGLPLTPEAQADIFHGNFDRLFPVSSL